MNRRSSQQLPARRAGKSRALLLLVLGLGLLLLAVYLFTRPLAPAPAAPASVLPASELAPTAEGFQAGEIAAKSSPTSAPARPSRASATPNDGLPAVAFDDLPRQAQETIRLIDSGGPFPFRQDGAVFQNRERLLPRQSSGYYREYTVITPGESDRGARRIVAGAEGELYYTADHYESFKRVVR